MTDIYHNSFELTYREPFGALPRGSTVSLAIDIPSHYQVLNVLLHFIFDKSHEKNSKEMDISSQNTSSLTYGVTMTLPKEPQLVWYFFEIVTEGGQLFYGRVNGDESGEGRIYKHIPPSWQITVYNPDYQTPTWWRHATMYQIFPDRFHVGGELELRHAPKTSLIHAHWDNDPLYIKDENGRVVRWDFFGGNLQGIIHKLDYIQSLGVTVIYLNPIFEAESNHRYDTGNYHKIDPLLGSKEDLEQLIKEATNRNIEIMLDGVFSHTGSNSIYFNQKKEYDSIGAYQSMESPYYSWYTFYEHPDVYEAWWGVDTLPTLNKENASYQNFLVHDEQSVIKTWQKSGIKHWRLDVADELTDDLIKEIYQQLKKEDQSSVLLGEVWEDASNKTAYGKRRDYLLGGVLDSVMNYPLREFMLGFIKGGIDAFHLEKGIMTLYEHYPKHYFYSVMNMISSHDVERIKTLLDDFFPIDMPIDVRAEKIREQVKALSLWQYTFPGIPSLYYGDEAGLTGGEDPDNRKPYPWGREESELVTWYQTIGGWRREHAALRTGSFKTHALHEDVFSFERWNQNGKDEFEDPTHDEHFLYIINRNHEEDKEVTISIRNGNWQHMLDNRIFHGVDGRLTVQLNPCESMLLRFVSDEVTS